MKNKFYIVLTLALILLSCNRQPEFRVIDHGLNHCTSLYAMHDTLLVSNLGSSDTLNSSVPNGYIMQLVGDSVFPLDLPDSVLYSPKGMIRVGDYLYVADVCRVHVVDMISPEHKVITIPLSTFESYANQFEVVGDMLLLSSTASDKVLALQLQDNGAPHYSGFQIYLRVAGPTGMVYHKGKLYIASHNLHGAPTAENVIYVIDDFTISQPRPFISRIGQYEGLAVKDDFLYFSDSNVGVVGKISLENPELIEFLEFNSLISDLNPMGLGIFNGNLCVSNFQNSSIIVGN